MYSRLKRMFEEHTYDVTKATTEEVSSSIEKVEPCCNKLVRILCCNRVTEVLALGFARIFLIIFNIIFVLSGVAIVTVSVWIVGFKSLNSFLDVVSTSSDDQYQNYVIYCLLGLGMFTSLIGYCGYRGARKKSTCHLGFYTVALLVVILGKVTTGGLGIIFKSTIDEKITSVMKGNIDQYTTSETSRQAWNFIQKSFGCCGATSINDWKSNDTIQVASFPTTCCVMNMSAPFNYMTGFRARNLSACFQQKSGFFHDKGCVTFLRDFLTTFNGTFIGLAFGIALLEITGIIAALYICCNTIKKA